MNKDRFGEYEKLEMLRALINARIWYFKNSKVIRITTKT